MRAAARLLLDRPWVVIAAAGAVAFTLWVIGTRKEPHHIKASFQAASSIRSGLDVQIAGVDVGKVSGVEYRDGHAIVTLGIEDGAWPLHHGTRAILRFGTTVGNGTRRVDLEPGPAKNPAIPEDGLIATKDTITPVEFDDVFNTLDAKTRTRVSRLAKRSSGALRGTAPALRSGLRGTPRATEAAAGLLSDLARDQAALDGLVVGAQRVTRTLAPRRAEISDLVSVAAATFQTLGSRSAQLRATIGELPQTLTQARSTLARLDGSAARATTLLRTLQPGAARLPALAGDLSRAAGRLREVAPVGVEVADAGIAAAPPATRLLTRGRPFLDELRPVLRDAAPSVSCLRPYAPEIAGTLTGWGGYTSNYDSLAHYGRIHLQEGAVSVNANPLTSGEFLKLVPGITFAMPRPPGLNADQPWFLPECGAGPEALDADKDPEARR